MVDLNVAPPSPNAKPSTVEPTSADAEASEIRGLELADELASAAFHRNWDDVRSLVTSLEQRLGGQDLTTLERTKIIDALRFAQYAAIKADERETPSALEWLFLIPALIKVFSDIGDDPHEKAAVEARAALEKRDPEFKAHDMTGRTGTFRYSSGLQAPATPGGRPTPIDRPPPRPVLVEELEDKFGKLARAQGPHAAVYAELQRALGTSLASRNKLLEALADVTERSPQTLREALLTPEITRGNLILGLTLLTLPRHPGAAPHRRCAR